MLMISITRVLRWKILIAIDKAYANASEIMLMIKRMNIVPIPPQ